MELSEHLMAALKFKTVFTIHVGSAAIPITETVIVSWIVMAIIIVGAFLLTRKLAEVPKKSQVFVEAYVGFLNNFSQEHFGHDKDLHGPYIGTLFIFLVLANTFSVLTPIGGFGFEAPFAIKPPTRDINVTAALAMMTILIVIVSGFRARGFVGWFKRLAYPAPFMVPFNLLEYAIRPLSLCLRLFGNILGAFIIMMLVEAVAPLVAPPVLSLYFDFLDGLIQALVFTFLTALFISEAIE